MITRLTIQNIGLIDRLSIEFRGHLNILTGETGAGKSILIDTLRFALGERMKTTKIRNPELPCTVEAVFELPDSKLREYDAFLEYFTNGGELIISRSYLPDGRSRAKINGFSVTLAQLKDLGDHLVDFHGPHDHQLLLSPESHMGMLDRLSNIDILKDSYVKKYQEYTGLFKKHQELKEMAISRERELGTLAYQMKELSSVPLDDAKYEELLYEQKRLNNAEKIYECINALVDTFENGDAGINEAIGRAFGPMKTLSSIDESTAEFAEQLSKLQDDASELLTCLTNYRDGLSFDSETAQAINTRYDIYYEITRKYGPTLEDARKFYELTKERYDLMADLEHNDASLTKKITSLKKELKRDANMITEGRKRTALSLQKTIKNELTDLGIKRVEFECRIEEVELNRNGKDSVTFYISPNTGESLKPLADIVSSGEAARVMLALKKALIKVDPVPVLIFDEIDAQIGGRLGTVTGRKLKELSDVRQVILITHLPQIASFADAHYKVSKSVVNNHTITAIEALDDKLRVKELAKMMSGDKESQISLHHAREMLTQAGNKIK